MYHIKQTLIEDLDTISWMYKKAIEYQKRNNYFGWEAIDINHLKNEIIEGKHYKIIEDSNILCAFGIMFSDPLIWREKEKGTSLYLHRVVVNPNFKGQNQFNKVLNWAIDYSISRNLNSIRIDTWTKNKAIIEFYKKFNFNVIEEYKTSDTIDLPIQHRNLDITLMEYIVKNIA
ncbi:N-acetyltransferase [uncultured Polaribacter sp.]|uniref:GNAT family N-acetyltransferase n=1 Tax=uncultured Polaribacter sp. TaxID=174711 RepID=UPI0026106370|nr:GNAT family N-acetyltransferase [uncultured Polaribacter sp.]